MKVGKLFDLLKDARDLLDYFEKVDTTEQLISRLERLKRGDTEDFLACVDGLRASLTALLDDVLEMSASLDEPDADLDEVGEGTPKENDVDDVDALLEAIGQEHITAPETPPTETQNPPADAAAQEPKNDVPNAE